MKVEDFVASTDAKRPDNDGLSGYYYFELLKEYLGGNLDRVFTDEVVYPRQFDVHLPGDGRRGCNFHCLHCQGRYFQQTLDTAWIPRMFSLVRQLDGRIPFIVVGGQYTEPTLSPDLMPLMRLTKETGSCFGCHSNGSKLVELEQKQGLMTEYVELSNSPQDYFSCSLDAGFAKSHMISKRLDRDHFSTIIDGLRMFADIRGDKPFPKLRVVYLFNKWNSSPKEVENIVKLAKEIGVDSLRFSIPYDNYNRDFDKVREYKKKVEVPMRIPYYNLVKPYLSENATDKPFIFWIAPEAQDIDQMNYKQCLFGYFQITLGADGYVYRCSSCAAPSMAFNRLGKVTDDMDKFMYQVKLNQSPKWNPAVCFLNNGRCNRCAVEINNAWRDQYGPDAKTSV